MSMQTTFKPIESTTKKITVAGTSAATSAATSGKYPVLRIATSTDCYITWGATSPTATTSDMLLTAGAVEYLSLPGQVFVAAIQVSAGGVLTVTECSYP